VAGSTGFYWINSGTLPWGHLDGATGTIGYTIEGTVVLEPNELFALGAPILVIAGRFRRRSTAR
jgi:hypothetical protein